MANPNAQPPEEYKWKPGQSGNPKGRPPKGYSITEMVREMLGSKPDVKQALINRIMKLAVEEGDMAAIRLIWQYMDGMPQQSLNAIHDIKTDGKPFKILMERPDKDGSISSDGETK